uniref:succinate dehydrogenase subunit 4 n=1 Tax=Eichhornia crassipes TaxID=44947 RepID=UPI002A7F32DE|nr:succinate dehydrogenase subunit 4 [Pontederia crassipes]WOW96097.1 succinate dehydrogenase subunit 4 [Pontederia crassipes]
MVLAFCRRGSVIPICLYLLVGRYMKERISGLRLEDKENWAFQKSPLYSKKSGLLPPFLKLRVWHINLG